MSQLPPTQPQNQEVELFSSKGIKVTNQSVVVPPNTWSVQQMQLVQPEYSGGKHIIRLVDRSGRQLHQLESDSAERIQQIAGAINNAISASPTPIAVSAQMPALRSGVVQAVEIVNFNMPFWALVGFMVKVSLASIPAVIILVTVMGVLWGVLGGIFLTLVGGFR